MDKLYPVRPMRQTIKDVIVKAENIPVLAPMESAELVEFRIGANGIPRRLVVKTVVQAPEMKYFIGKVGSSRKRGRRASHLFFANLLAHKSTDIPNLVISDVRVDNDRQLVGGPIPAALFAPDSPMNLGAIDVVGRTLRVTFHNREQYRKVQTLAIALVRLPA